MLRKTDTSGTKKYAKYSRIMKKQTSGQKMNAEGERRPMNTIDGLWNRICMAKSKWRLNAARKAAVTESMAAARLQARLLQQERILMGLS
ncbi:DgyrCDS3023 [Dimorphilus gyrociliatus]|uniref:DgyrCDS3023 n=1 Tax=Dimorphilus gyrociliatus TaxID=2664684 RepID=A0A7I8VF02_9ANNE|nr:DgyrCDS3023 [Dimorphilus gyrociliatus]